MHERLGEGIRSRKRLTVTLFIVNRPWESFDKRIQIYKRVILHYPEFIHQIPSHILYTLILLNLVFFCNCSDFTTATSVLSCSTSHPNINFISNNIPLIISLSLTHTHSLFLLLSCSFCHSLSLVIVFVANEATIFAYTFKNFFQLHQNINSLWDYIYPSEFILFRICHFLRFSCRLVSVSLHTRNI